MHYAQDEGESHQAKVAVLRVAKIVKTNTNNHFVNFIEPSTASGGSPGDDEHSYVIDDGSIPIDELPSTIDTSSYQPLLYLGTNILHQRPFIVKPKQLAAGDRNTAASSPGWVEP